MTKKKLRVLILGGRGFVGRSVGEQLRNHVVFTFDSHPGGRNHFQGTITSLQDLKTAMRGMDCVINLVGLSPLRKPSQTSYQGVHVKGIQNVLSACKTLKMKRFVHMSALGADVNSSIEFLRTKGVAERLVLKSNIRKTVFCPSIIFDKENELIQQISKMSFTCMFPNITAKIQPVYRNDIAKLFALTVQGKIKEKKIEVGGPESMTIFQMAQKIHRKKGFPCFPIPLFMLKIGMKVASWLHLFGITDDQIKSLSLDNAAKIDIPKKYVSLTNFDVWLKRTVL